MGEIVNLRRARKTAERQRRQTEAAANRASHGRTIAEKQAERATAAALKRTLDGARREES